MSRLLLMWWGTFALASAGLFAQSGAPQQTTQKATTGVVATVTATGCLERWHSEAIASPTDTADTAPAGVEYVLTHVEGQSASATAAGPGKTATTEPETRYLLLPSPSQNYAAHLNHKMTIVGSIAPQPSPGASESERVANPTSRETNLPAEPKAAAYHYNLVDVSSLRMVSRSCGGY